MSIMYPGSKNKIVLETKRLLIKKIIISLASFIILTVFDNSLFWIIVSIMLIYAINATFEAHIYSKLNMRLLKQFEDFLNDLSFQYRYCKNIEEAFLETVMNSNYEIALHANFLYELLTKEDYEGNLDYYKSVCPNNYFLMFYSICYMVKSQGDKETANGSVFIMNINRLIADINDVMNKNEKLDAAFSGLFLISILPVFLMKPMEIWAISNIEGLRGYYQGLAGTLSTFFVALISIFIYMMIKKMKYPFLNPIKKSILIEKLTYRINENSDFLNHLIAANYSKYKRLAMLLTRTGNIYSVKEFQVKRCVQLVIFSFVGLITAIAFKAPYAGIILMTVLGGITGYFISLYAIAFSYESIKNDIADEIITLQATIGICMYQEGIDVQGLLLHMEKVARFYKKALEKASDSFDGNGMIALNELKEGEYNRSFLRIIDGLMACDILPIEESFANLEKERNFDLKRKIITEEKMLANKSALAKFMAFIPLILSIVLKLILPFVMEGMNSLVTFSTEF